MKKVKLGVNICWALMCLSFMWPVFLFFKVVPYQGSFDIRAVLLPIIYTLIVVVQSIVIGRGLYLQKSWAMFVSLIPTTMAFVATVPSLVNRLIFMARYGGFEGPKGEGSPMLFIFGLLLVAPVAICTVIYIVSLAVWVRKSGQIARENASLPIEPS